MEDEITMNTQCSSQWDGLRHAAIQNPVTYYNNFTQEDFLSGDCLGVHRKPHESWSWPWVANLESDLVIDQAGASAAVFREGAFWWTLRAGERL